MEKVACLMGTFRTRTFGRGFVLLGDQQRSLFVPSTMDRVGHLYCHVIYRATRSEDAADVL
jgi:hypothetical protein